MHPSCPRVGRGSGPHFCKFRRVGSFEFVFFIQLSYKLIIFQGRKIGDVKQSTNTPPRLSKGNCPLQGLENSCLQMQPASVLERSQDHTKEYPVMAVTVSCMLCISARSVQSERDFSSVGHTITDARSLL
jgi:hAT family C-terminal dimerisation region